MEPAGKQTFGSCEPVHERRNDKQVRGQGVRGGEPARPKAGKASGQLFGCVSNRLLFFALCIFYTSCLTTQATMNDASVDGSLKLDASQVRALDSFREGASIALLGRAGSGKREVLRRIVADATARWGPDAVAVAALSGSAALAIGGQTLHSLFGMDTRPLSRESWLRIILERRGVCKRLNALRVRFVDEVCTVVVLRPVPKINGNVLSD